MSSRRTLPIYRSVTVACCMLALCAALTLQFASTSEAAYYKMVLCGANNGSNSFGTDTNTRSGSNPNGIFSFGNFCGPAPYPAGNNATLFIDENQPNGFAGQDAWGRIFWQAPSEVAIAGAGGYSRMPAEFHEGWRGMFWVEGFDGSQNNILVQGTGVANGSCGGVCWNTTSSYGPHLWPFGGYGNYRKFVVELHCFRAAGCDRAGSNAFDTNSFQLILSDSTVPALHYTDSRPLQEGLWSRGQQPISWKSADDGSGIRFERVSVDGSEVRLVDRRGSCNMDSHSATGEFARDFKPCPSGVWLPSSFDFNTATLGDGTHSLSVCLQDFAQAQGLSGSGGQTCEQRSVRTDNSPPAAPSGLKIVSANPERYLPGFGAKWQLVSDPGSPIAKVHYDVVDAAGKVVVPENTRTATNPTILDDVSAPSEPGDYRLRVWLEDSVGFSGPAASVPIPRDTKPPAAAQEISVTAPSVSRASEGFDVRWRNIVDEGSPIDEVHYQVLNGAGDVVVSTKTIKGDNPQAIGDLETPRDAGNYTLRMWLSDAEGNVGAPSTAPLTYQCVRSEQRGGTSISAGLGPSSEKAIAVNQGLGATLSGTVGGGGGSIQGATVCVFSRVVTQSRRDFLGVAITDPRGHYSFGIAPEASRELTVMYRGDQREVDATSTILTRVKPTFKVRKRVVQNKRAAVFSGEIPGPDNDKVVVVLQVKSGKGWRAFRRYRTRSDGRYVVRYRFTRTRTPTVYVMRAQVRSQLGYPYLQGNSNSLKVKVKP